jgi:hypothetical protein
MIGKVSRQQSLFRNRLGLAIAFVAVVLAVYSPCPIKLAVVFGYGGGGGVIIYPQIFSKTITAFSIPGQINEAIIDQNARTIILTMPYGTDLSSLVPVIAITGTSVNPDSGTANDFSVVRTYTVTAADGSTQNYAVTVNVVPATPPATHIPDQSSAARVTDIIRDGKIDILDFNALMVDWGRNGQNERADVNYDGSVDILDFNLVMVYWGQTQIR